MANGPPAGRGGLRTQPWFLIAVVALTGLMALAVGLAVRPTSSPTPDYVHLTSIEWLNPDGSVLATSSGVNLSQGQAFTTSVLLHCAASSSSCPGTRVIAAPSATSLGSWPAGVSPCGWFRASFNVTGSNLPQPIPSNGTVAVDLSLQAPVVSYPNAQHVDQPFDYTGYLEVQLSFAP